MKIHSTYVKKFRSNLNGLRFYHIHFMMWHDGVKSGMKPPHERLVDIVGGNDHQFKWRERFLFCAARNRYYSRIVINKSTIDNILNDMLDNNDDNN